MSSQYFSEDNGSSGRQAISMRKNKESLLSVNLTNENS